MATTLYLLLIFFLFFILGKSADFLIINVKKISERLGLKIFTIGILLGVLTTMPEFFIGINAIKNNVSSLSSGNLFGGIIMLFTLLLGINLILNEKIETDGNIKNILPNLLFILLAIVSGLKGFYNFYDGIFFIFLYFIIIFYVNKKNGISVDNVNILENKKNIFDSIKNIFTKAKEKKVLKELLITITSLCCLLLSSSLIINLSTKILNQFNISDFFIGLIMFSIGTNLPEFIVILRSFKNKSSDLSLSHLIGSAMANIFILSILSLFNNFKINTNASYMFLLFFAILSVFLITMFYRSNKSFSKKEGYVLLIVYIIFFISQFLYEIA